MIMKAYRFDGERGEKIIEYEIPENLKSEAEKYRHDLIEKIVGEDNSLAEKDLEGKDITLDELKRVLRQATIKTAIIPILVGSALKNKGVQLVLDAVVDYLPSPIDVPPTKGTDPKTGEVLVRNPSDDDKLSALAFKIAADPFVGLLTFVRVYSGVLKKGSYVYNSSKDAQERIGRIVRIHADKREEIDEISSGDIGAVIGLKSTTTGDTLCDDDHRIVLEKIKFPEPVISVRIEPNTKDDQERMGMALRRLAEEDPTFRVSGDIETGETIISGMGELHLEIIVDRMKREFNVHSNVGRPQVAYKETILGEAEAEGKYIRQSGGKGQYGHVWLKVKALERGKGFVFVDAVRGGVIPREFIPAVEKGVRETITKGVVAGFPLIDIEVTLFDGSYHEVDSSESAFKIAGSIAFREASKKAKPVVLEPIMKTQVIAPQQFMGDVTGDISSKRGKIEAINDRADIKIIDFMIPLSEMFGYVTKLRSMTQGRGGFTMEFDHYEVVPASVTQLIIDGKK
jgi:elongation factor G